MSAQEEMMFVKKHIFLASGHDLEKQSIDDSILARASPPLKVWDCLQSAIEMCEPVLIFPVSDMETYQPIATMTESAINCPSLPNAGMVSCLKAAGGSLPTLWDDQKLGYASSLSENVPIKSQALRDVLLMKPKSTVEDVFAVANTMWLYKCM